MKVTTGEIIGTLETKQMKAPVRRYRNNPGDFSAAAFAAKHYANTRNCTMVVIPGNSYGRPCFRIAHVTEDFAKYRVGCMDGRVAVVYPNADDVYEAQAV